MLMQLEFLLVLLVGLCFEIAKQLVTVFGRLLSSTG